MARQMPLLPPHLVKTYSIKQPFKTHFRKATCAEVDCAGYLGGFMLRLDESTTEGQYHAETIRGLKTHKYTTTRDESGLTVFTFPAGQECFKQHTIAAEREPFYVVTGGDWRGNPRNEVRVHQHPGDWVDDFANHQIKLAEAAAEG